MPSSALHGFALLMAACILYVVASGVSAHGVVLPESHRLTGIALLVLSMVEAGWVIQAVPRLGPRLMAGLQVLGLMLMAFLTGFPAVHATVAQFVFGAAAAVAGLTASEWQRGPRLVADEGTPSMRTLAWLAPAGVGLQVALGAGLRHGALPVWPHISGSLLVGGLLLFAGMAVMQSYSMHESLRRAGVTLLLVTGLQVMLGMAAYGVRMMKQPEAWTVWLTMGHVLTGALTLGASLMFAFQVFYHVRESLFVQEAAA